jgi:D-aspartate ligase
VIEAPHPEDNEEEFVEVLAHAGDEARRSMLVPTTDETLGTVARNRERLEQRYVVASPGRPAVQAVLDKWRTYEIAERVGVSVPDTFAPRSVEELEGQRKAFRFPCLVKPRIGHRYYERFGRKMTKVNSFDELLSAYREATEAGHAMMVQEFIPGDDTHGVNFNAYCIRGEPRVWCTAEKIRLAPPGTGRPRVAVSKQLPELKAPATALLGAFGYEGFSCTEFKRDARDGSFKLMEINARHNLSTGLSVACGVNFPVLEYLHHMRGDAPDGSARPRTGLYWIDGLSDAAFGLRYALDERYSPLQVLRPYARPHVRAVFDPRDPRPAWARVSRRFRRADS